jgi:streptomycin 6-kinase
LADGTQVVVKIHLEDDTESLQVPDALRFWNGRGTVLLIDYDPETRAMILERCVPGTPLGTAYDDASIEIAAAVLRRLWRPPSDDVEWRTLADVAERWLRELPRRYPPSRLLDEALDALRVLASSQEDVVLCHQDLHGGNILSAEREPWLAIDAKPIVAEPAYDAVALIRDTGSDAAPTLAQLRRRLDVFAELLDIDRERVRLWGVAKCIAWDRPDEAALFSEVGSRR